MRLGLMVVAFAPVLLAAQVTPQFGHNVPAPSAMAARRAGPVTLDAKLEEAAWKAATPITSFLQTDPDEGKPATQRTEVRFLYDNDALYVGARMYDDSSRASSVMTRLVRRDGTFDSDFLDIEIDGYHDHLSRAVFQVNPSGSKADMIGIGTSCCDQSWDPVWEAATHIDDDGWTAEIRIPYSQLRFSRDSVQVWGLQVGRFIKRREENDVWAFTKKTEAGGPPRYGHLVGLRIPATTAHLELLPYAVTKSSSLGGGRDNPFNTRGRPSVRAGLDVKARLTSNLTLDATLNPDFGQVEVDPAVLNLSAFETFFPEKRPFFIEGAQVFDFANHACNFCDNTQDMNAFYSRRVGRAPSGASLTDDYRFADVPDATTILGAGKITGRTPGGYTLGLMNAVTARATADVESRSGSRARQEVEPLADYFVGRVKRDFMNGKLVAGLVASGVVRDIDSTFAPLLARHAELVGHDVFWSSANHEYDWRMQAAITNVAGDPREMLLRQQSSARYFQRPDRGRGSGGFFSSRLDSSATSMRGGGLYTRLAKETGAWFGELSLDTRTPGYESNDYAFQTLADYVFTNGNVGKIWTKPTSWYHQAMGIVGAQTIRTYEGDRTNLDYHAFLNVTTPQFWSFTLAYIDNPSVIDDRQLRGGPAVRSANSYYLSAEVSSDSRHAVVANADASYSRNDRGDLSPRYSLGLTYRPAAQVSLSFNPSYFRGNNYAQYVTSKIDTTALRFYGTRYVVARLDQPILELDTRASVTFSPTMTLEVYVQPFFAAARYRHFGEYAEPRTSETIVYGRDAGTITAERGADGIITRYTIDADASGPSRPFTLDNPDFSQQSLRGNAVFRWEYRPGSVLYVAWTQSRVADAPFGDLRFSRDRAALLRSRPDNIMLVKASWWFPR